MFWVLDRLKEAEPHLLIRHGACRATPYWLDNKKTTRGWDWSTMTGADAWADDWCWDREVPFECYPADFELFGREDGPRRNRRMLDTKPRPLGVIAFPGGRGTASTKTYARSLGIEVVSVTETGALY